MRAANQMSLEQRFERYPGLARRAQHKVFINDSRMQKSKIQNDVIGEKTVLTIVSSNHGKAWRAKACHSIEKQEKARQQILQSLQMEPSPTDTDTLGLV